MSHPVFLESPPWPRMPEGRKGELKPYFAAGGPSLEANACLPLFWLTLFSVEDVHFAHIIDDFDPEDEAIELEEFLESVPPDERDATYPYLVTTKALALERTARRREALVALLGERYRLIHDAFVEYIRTAYGPFVLVRTSGLPDVMDATGWLTDQLERMGALEHGTPIDAGLARDVEEARRASDGNAVWLTTGVGDPRAEVNPWPSPRLVEAFPACAPRPRGTARGSTDAPKAGGKYTYRDQTSLDKTLEWLAILLFGVSAAATWVLTHSLWKAVLATVLITAVMVWLMLRVRRVG